MNTYTVYFDKDIKMKFRGYKHTIDNGVLSILSRIGSQYIIPLTNVAYVEYNK